MRLSSIGTLGRILFEFGIEEFIYLSQCRLNMNILVPKVKGPFTCDPRKKISVISKTILKNLIKFTYMKFLVEHLQENNVTRNRGPKVKCRLGRSRFQ